MNIKNILRIIFRIFGLYSAINLIFYFLPNQVTYLINAQIFFPFDTENGILQTWIYLIIVLLFLIAEIYFLIINPDLIINKLKPNKFLDEKIEFGKLDSENLLQIAILSLGILILFDSIPELINKIFIFSKISNMNENTTEDLTTLGIKSEILTAATKTIIGFVFIIFQNKIGKFLYR